MSEKMIFPETVDEFMEQYKVVDTEKVYTSGIELVPIFRMKQWFEHLPAVPQEMSASELYSVYQRICKEYNLKRKPVRCYECPLYVDCPRIGEALRMVMVCGPRIEKWAREHPERSEE